MFISCIYIIIIFTLFIGQFFLDLTEGRGGRDQETSSSWDSNSGRL